MDDAELQLIIDACRSILPQQPTRVELPKEPLNWDRLLFLGRRHRVQAVIWAGLQPVRDQIPAHCSDHLRRDAEEVVRSNLQIAGESARLLQLFQSEKVDLLFLKGLALAALAYSDPYLKMGWDIDVLVPSESIADACQLMRRAGYSPVVPKLATDQQLAKWHKARKELVWQSEDGRFHVDLHSRLSDNPKMLSGVGLHSPRQIASLGHGIELPTLGPDDLFAYLCVHGASSAWFRLKWALDLAAFLAPKDSVQIQSFYVRSQELGAGRASAQALILVDRLFLDLPSTLQAQLNGGFWNRWLAATALRELTEEVEPTERPLGTRMIHLSQLAMMPRMGFVISEAGRQLRDLGTRPI